MANSLEQLKKYTTVVADTGDFETMKAYKPQDSTTNPSLLLTAAQLPAYKPLYDSALQYGKEKSKDLDEQVKHTLDKMAINFGVEILKIVPGRVSTEIDARLSFDTEATVKKGRELIALYKEAGISKDRVLIKIASTWEGIRAGEILEKEGIHVNMTLLFSLTQAVACAEAGATLISPFVGRITDFYKKKENKDSYAAPEDPGVLSVKNIFNYFKHYNYKTVVMGASFRNKEQVMELAGCDLLTVSPALLKELADSNVEVVKKLDSNKTTAVPRIDVSQQAFLWALNDDEMAHFKLAEGIRKFAADSIKLEEDIRSKLKAMQ